MDPNKQAYQNGVWFGMLFGGLLIGSLIGLIPLKFGSSRGDDVVGKVGFFACIVGGFISGILGAFSMAIGFVIAILVGGRKG